jgi:TonB family protein
VDRVKITPRKKTVKITIDRELVIAAKRQKEPKSRRGNGAITVTAAPAPPAGEAAEPSEADQAKAQIAAAPEAERPADPASLTTTTSPQHAANVLRAALDRVFADGISDIYLADLPEYWKIYFQNLAAGKDYKPSDPSVLRQRDVDRKARLVSVIEPKSNELAQAHDVAGIVLVHTVIGPDGKPHEIALGQPIGFGLDENAIAAIRNATFEPALKNGHPVAVALDLTVQFHIYSKLTSTPASVQDPDKTPATSLPGPYSTQHP